MAFAAQIRDPEHHKFTTPSGKIEIYSMALAAKPDPYGLGAHPANPDLDRAGRGPQPHYPLQAVHAEVARPHAFHPRQPGRAWPASIPTMSGCTRAMRRRAASPTAGRVRVFNERGATVLPVKVTDRIAPGAVSIKEGAWFTPDETGVDTKAAPTC